MMQSNMAPLDWAIAFGVISVVFVIGAITRKHMKSVADFLAANRCAGRYLLCISDGIAGLGAISVIGFFEVYYSAGFTAVWWAQLMAPIGLIITLSGWVIYRFRETRALTLAQFFEERYSKRLRIFAGTLMWISGIVNYGIFPAVTTRFFIHFCGLPEQIGGVPTFPLIMAILLSAALILVFCGGQIAIMITDFTQGVFVNVAFVIMLIALAFIIDWNTLISVLMEKAPEGKSLIDPFKTSNIDDFNIYFYLIGTFGAVYAFRSWQGSQAYSCSAKSAHEAKMAGILGVWRGIAQATFLILVPVVAYALLHGSQFANIVHEVQPAIDFAGKDNPQIGRQMTVSILLSKVLPSGIIGLFCAVMLCAAISTDDTYLHSWGSILVQDVILPFRKKPFTPKQHLLILRCSIAFVAVFAYSWSLLFRQTQHIQMFFVITGAIWIGGAGSVILGGLYWKRGTTLGAFAALSLGAAIALTGIFADQMWEKHIYPWLAANPALLASVTSFFDTISKTLPGINWKIKPDKFVFNGQWINFFSMASALGSYVVVSLVEGWVTRAKPFNLDRMLHRGEYAVAGDHTAGVVKPVCGWRAILPSAEFTFGDKCIYWANLAYTLTFISIFLVGTVYSIYHHAKYGTWFSDSAWATYWYVYIVFHLVLAVLTTIWFLIGGLFDLRDLLRTLSSLKRNPMDMGMVVNHHDLADETIAGLKEHIAEDGQDGTEDRAK